LSADNSGKRSGEGGEVEEMNQQKELLENLKLLQKHGFAGWTIDEIIEHIESNVRKVAVAE